VSTAIEVRKQPDNEDQNALLWIGRDRAAYEALCAYMDPLADRSEVIGLSSSEAYALVIDALEVTHSVQS
jgi:hypothetical protein